LRAFGSGVLFSGRLPAKLRALRLKMPAAEKGRKRPKNPPVVLWESGPLYAQQNPPVVLCTKNPKRASRIFMSPREWRAIS